VIKTRENYPVSWQVLAGAACAYVGGQKDVPEAVNVKLIEIIFGEIQFEPAAEIFDASFKLFPVKGRD
jgi:hypothetical protein